MIRVLLVDDQALVRSGFRIILSVEPDIEVVGEAADGLEAVALAAELRPDVICMDVEMPNLDGIAATRRILSEPPTGSEPPAVLVLTTFGHEEYLFDALAAGVSGFLLKTARAEQFVDAVRTLAAGHALLGPDVTRAVMSRAAEGAGGSGEPGGADGSGEPGGSGGTDRTLPITLPRSAANARAGADPGAGGAPAGSAPDDHTIDPAALDSVRLTEREREVLALIALGRSNAEIACELFLGEATIKTHVSKILQKLGARDRIQAVVWAHTHGGR